MEIQDGKMQVLLPGGAEWKSFAAGDSFHVPANATFQLNVETIVDYCCHYG